MKKKTQAERVPPETVVEHIGSSGYQHLIPQPTALLLPAPSIIETVYFSRVGHTFRQLPPNIFPPGSPTMYAVQDFLLDQTGTSGADGKLKSPRSFDLTAATFYRFDVLPKNPNKRIQVITPASGKVSFSLNVGRRYVNAASDYADPHVANAFFLNLVGPTPVVDYNLFSIGHNTNHWVQFRVMADVVGSIWFHGFSTHGHYPPRFFDPGTKSYLPFSTSIPFNLPSQYGVPHLMFSYVTKEPVDPGPFVSLM